MAEALRAEYRLCEVLPVAGMAKSSCEYARSAQAKGETEGHAAARKAVIEAFGAGGGTYGYRRMYAQVNADAGDGAAMCLVKPRFRKRALLSFGFRHESFSGSGAGTPLYS